MVIVHRYKYYKDTSRCNAMRYNVSLQKKQQKSCFPLMSSLQTYYHFKLGFQKSGPTYWRQVVKPQH